MIRFIRIFNLFLFLLLIISCSNNHKPSAEILGSVQGIAVKGENGKLKVTGPEEKLLRSGESVVWYVYLRTNMKSVRYTEEVTMSASTGWELGDNKNNTTNDEEVNIIEYKISDDGSKIIVLREVKNPKGFIFGTWSMTDKDPVGPIKTRVIIENQVSADFSWELVKD
jgi:hypothetical protein